MKPAILADNEEKEMYRLYRLYCREAERCGHSKAYLAGCIMCGSALESILILMVNIYMDDIVLPERILKEDGSPKPLLSWSLFDLLETAKSVGWLSGSQKQKENRRIRQIGDFADNIRKIRNFVHPARFRKDHFGRRITKSIFEQQLEVLRMCQKRLFYFNNLGLEKEISRHENQMRPECQ